MNRRGALPRGVRGIVRGKGGIIGAGYSCGREIQKVLSAPCRKKSPERYGCRQQHKRSAYHERGRADKTSHNKADDRIGKVEDIENGFLNRAAAQ